VAAALSHSKKKRRRRRRKTFNPGSPPRVHDAVKPPPPSRPPKPDPHPDPGPRKPPPVFGHDFGNPQIKRLLWRAGFGPRPGDVDALAGKPMDQVVKTLTRPSDDAQLIGPEPVTDDGPIAPYDAWAHDHLWWLDRMVRSNQPLIERMALIWHDWFATSDDKVGSARLMIDQSNLFRLHALGSFKDLLTAVTTDPAMLVWLDGIDNRRRAPNENYARELMELFTLGANRGAYTETDVRQMALCLTGWRADWVDGTGWANFRYDPTRHDNSNKTPFGKPPANYGWQDVVQFVLENPYHASFFVTKLWSYFVPTPPDDATQASLQKLYLDNDYAILPVVEAILTHPDFYAPPTMVKPPVVFTAGLLRALGRGIDTESWIWLCESAGQRLFVPPNVAGWDDSAWLDTSRWRARWWIANYAFENVAVNPWDGPDYPNPTEDAPTALNKALGTLGNPILGTATRDVLAAFSKSSVSPWKEDWQQAPYRAMRLNALRQLIATSPDYQTS
jgi:uncharacterized protein (DUF1800 family)